MAAVTKNGDQRVYGTPAVMAKAIKVDLSVALAEGSLYADDALNYSVKEFVKGSITLNVADLTNDVIAQLLGWETDQDGVIYAGNENLESPPAFALAFASKKPEGKYRYIWLYEVTFSIPAESYQTKGDQITILTPTIEGEFIRRPTDGRWKADYVGTPTGGVAADWFNAVREFAE
jgi:phi13 family phage major tail protein